MRLFSYVVARDYGFAPNPFYGVCSLAACKPVIRRVASIGDWVVGTGSTQRDRKGYLVYAMCVSETVTFNEYWTDKRFQKKKPNLRGSKKQAFGDNIYFINKSGEWSQRDSHHSYSDGTPNPYNIINDTKVNRILLGTVYSYWGGDGRKIPLIFRDYDGYDVCAGWGHKSRFPNEMIADFIAWVHSLNAGGYQGPPLDWNPS